MIKGIYVRDYYELTMSWWAGVRSEVCFASLSAALLPPEMRSEATWWPWQCMMSASTGILAAFRSWCISGALVMGGPFAERSLHSFQMAACECMMWEVYLESMHICAHLLAARVSALGSAISSGFGEEVPSGRGWDSITSESETIAYPGTLSPFGVV